MAMATATARGSETGDQGLFVMAEDGSGELVSVAQVGRDEDGNDRAAWVAKAPGRPAYLVEAHLEPDDRSPSGASYQISAYEIGGEGFAIVGADGTRAEATWSAEGQGPGNDALVGSTDASGIEPSWFPELYPVGRGGGWRDTRFEPIDVETFDAALVMEAEGHEDAVADAVGALPSWAVERPYEANFPEGQAPDVAAATTGPAADVRFEREELADLNDAMYGDPKLSGQALEARAYELCGRVSDRVAGLSPEAEPTGWSDGYRAGTFAATYGLLRDDLAAARAGESVGDGCSRVAKVLEAVGAKDLAEECGALSRDMGVASSANREWSEHPDLPRSEARARALGERAEGTTTRGHGSASVSEIASSLSAVSVPRDGRPSQGRADMAL